MELAGLLHSSVLTGGAPVYVALGDLSVLLGANDTGKSRSLVVLHEVLRDLDPLTDSHAEPAPLSIPEFEATLFVELSDDEASAACSAALRDLLEGDDDLAASGSIGQRPLHAYSREWLDELEADEALFEIEAIDTWLSLVRRSAGLEDPRYEPLFDALRASRLAAVYPPDPARGYSPSAAASVLRLALPNSMTVDESIAAVLVELGCNPDAPGPVVVLPYGDLTIRYPTPMWVPKHPRSIEQDLLGVLVQAVVSSGLLQDQRTFNDRDLLNVWSALLEESDPASAKVVPAFGAFCGLAQMVANEVLPDFVAEVYWISVKPQPISAWPDRTPLKVAIQSRDAARQFDLAQAAEGLQLWLQLALLEAVVAIRRLVSRMDGLSASRQQTLWGRAPEEAMQERLDALFAQRITDRGFSTHPYFRIAALDVLEVIGRDLFDDEAFRTRMPELVERGLDVAALFGGGVHCYFIDEPERHLHPSVARKAARWLRDVMTEREAQCVVTTHSVPFLDAGDAAAYNYLWRRGGKIFSQRFDPDTLHSFSLLAEEMGFDRGELLTTIRQLLFVEGRADQIVLQALFGRELRRLGVAVIPIHGIGRLHRVVEAEALFQYTAADLRVLVDNDIAPLVPELRRDPAKLEAALRDKKNTELQAVAQLLRTAQQAERDNDLEVLSIPAPDMFFMLDAAVISETCGGAYPSHEEAEACWRQMRETTGQRLNRKRFRADRYGVPEDLSLYAQVSAVMHERGLVPAGLQAVIDDLSRWSD